MTYDTPLQASAPLITLGPWTIQSFRHVPRPPLPSDHYLTLKVLPLPKLLLTTLGLLTVRVYPAEKLPVNFDMLREVWPLRSPEHMI